MLREEGAPRSHLCAHALGAGCNVAATVAKAAAVSACEAVGGATPATTAVTGTAPLEKAAAA